MRTAALMTVLVLAAAGCSAPAPAPLPEPPQPELSRVQAVREGMKAAEVRSLLGDPQLVEQDPDTAGRETWYYTGGVVVFQDERVAYRRALPVGPVAP